MGTRCTLESRPQPCLRIQHLLKKCHLACRGGCVHCLFFFFQAEDGIRDLTVTGVQTCALPIYASAWARSLESLDRAARASDNLVPLILDAVRANATVGEIGDVFRNVFGEYVPPLDRKSTRLNSSHSQISYAVFCLKKKNTSLRDRRGAELDAITAARGLGGAPLRGAVGRL